MSTTEQTIQDFRELERLYAERPSAYRRKLGLWIALGYGYVLLTIAVVLVFVVGGSWLFLSGSVSVVFADNFIKVAIPLLIAVGLMTRALFLRLPSPEGVYLEGALKRKVLDVFEDTRVRAGGRKIDAVVLTNDLNAAVVQTPRFGLFGPATNYLILGTPLLQLLTADEVRAVIAHEFGHLSHGHGKMGSVVYRLDRTLASAARAIHEKSKGRFKDLSFRFLNWFYRHFNVVSFAMRRGQEYEADRVAASATRAEALASALCKLNAYAECLNAFWGEVWQRPRTVPSNEAVFPQTELGAAVLEKSTPESEQRLVESALARDTDFRDSHPCLRERLAALEVAAVKAFADTASAIDALFTVAEKQELLALVDHAWQRLSALRWQQANEEHAREVAAMQELRGADGLGREDLQRLASLEERIEGALAAKATYRRLLESAPEDAWSQFQWGRVNLGQDEATAHTALLRCLKLDISYFPDVKRLFGDRMPDDLQARMSRLEAEYKDECERAQSERATVSADDKLVAVQMGDEFRAALVAHAAKYSEIRRLFVVEKLVEHMAHDRIFLLGFDVNTWHDDVESDEQKWLARVSDDFRQSFPGLNNPFGALVRKKNIWAQRLPDIEGALVYEGKGKQKKSLWQKTKFAYALLILGAIVAGLIMGIFDL